MDNVLYVFFTHRDNYENCSGRISDMMKGRDYLLVRGGYSTNFIEGRTLSLNCNDGYIGLSEKVMKCFTFLKTEWYFGKYTHIVKLDDDMIVKRDVDFGCDYGGNVHKGDGNRKWHFGKTDSYLDSVPFMGKFEEWCKGGYGYVLSSKVLMDVVPDFDYPKYMSYEDVYVGSLMKKINVKPVHIPNLEDYLISPVHGKKGV